MPGPCRRSEELEIPSSNVSAAYCVCDCVVTHLHCADICRVFFKGTKSHERVCPLLKGHWICTSTEGLYQRHMQRTTASPNAKMRSGCRLILDMNPELDSRWLELLSALAARFQQLVTAGCRGDGPELCIVFEAPCATILLRQWNSSLNSFVFIFFLKM